MVGAARSARPYHRWVDTAEVEGLPIAEFAFPGPLRDRLVGLILAGVKTTSTGLLVEYELDGDAIASPGDCQAVVDSNGRPVAVIEIVDARVSRLADVDLRHALDEGEGDADVASWRAGHERFWRSYLPELRERLSDPSFDIDDDTMVVLERFRLVGRIG
jgi:uncharacterized protein YhfF